MRSPFQPSLFVILMLTWVVAGGVAVASDVVVSIEVDKQWVKAIDNDDTQTIRTLLDSVTDAVSLLGLTSETGKSALMIGCKMGDEPLVRELLALGADAHQKTRTGGTPFMYASLGNHVPIARLLLKQKVDINAQGSNGWSATTLAAAKGFSGMLSFLIDIGADTNVPDVYRWTPLMRATDNRHYDSVSLLLGLADIELNTQSDTGNTALHIAAASGDEKMLSLLLSSDIDRNTLNAEGSTALQLVAALPNGGKLSELFSPD